MFLNKLCKICQSPFSNEYTFREMMFGFRDPFIYYECSGCGCLQIAEVPADIERYYPSYYYSFNSTVPALQKRKSGIRGLVNQLLKDKKERRLQKEASGYLKPINITNQHRILDIGCGKGELICRLFNMGFEHVSGTDKYLPEEINHDFGVKIMKKDLKDIEAEAYDLLMMHHVFEHMFFPEEELRECHRILKAKSYLMIRIPIKGFAWEKYKQDWVQLDAPRHFFIHTLKSMKILAEKTGFIIPHIIFDSTPFQFEGSELYKRDMPLHDETTHRPNSVKSILNKKERMFFKEETKRLNEDGTGDQAVFYLYKE